VERRTRRRRHANLPDAVGDALARRGCSVRACGRGMDDGEEQKWVSVALLTGSMIRLGDPS
jgi:hypothetical protein